MNIIAHEYKMNDSDSKDHLSDRDRADATEAVGIDTNSEACLDDRLWEAYLHSEECQDSGPERCNYGGKAPKFSAVSPRSRRSRTITIDNAVQSKAVDWSETTRRSTGLALFKAPGDHTPKRRGISLRKKVVAALRTMVENDSRFVGAKEHEASMRSRLDAAFNRGAVSVSEVAAAKEDWQRSVALVNDFHLVHLQAIADKIERCGRSGSPACQSYWCPNCRARFGARLAQDTQARLRQRYGEDLENARDQLLHVTILNEIVIPDPDVTEFGTDFNASTVRRDHSDITSYLKRWQSEQRSAVCNLLEKRKLSLELIEDWVRVDDWDRRFYSDENLIADAVRIAEFNTLIVAAQRNFKSRRRCVKLKPKKLISWRESGREEQYMDQLRRASKLDYDDIIQVARSLQCIYRNFSGITKTNFPERLKLKSSLEKVKNRQRNKLYRLNKDLPGVSVIGQFELELIDLRHAIGGSHQHKAKAETLRLLASQERKKPRPRKDEGPISFEAHRRRAKRTERQRLLDEARARIAANNPLPEEDFPGLQYAVLLHMHVLIDLNDHSRDDVEKWLAGRAGGNRRFKGQWPLRRQVMVKTLFKDKPVNDSLRDISFYPFKGVTSFNYENTAPRNDESHAEGDPANFTDEALALIAWLQHGIGHESLRLAINWPGVDAERRGRKATRVPVERLADEDMDAKLQQVLGECGVHPPGTYEEVTDLTKLFE